MVYYAHYEYRLFSNRMNLVDVSDNKMDWGSAVATGISVWEDASTYVEVNTTIKTGRYVKIEVTDTESPFNSLRWGVSPSSPIFDVYGSEN